MRSLPILMGLTLGLCLVLALGPVRAESLAPLFKRVLPSVAVIHTSQRQVSQAAPNRVVETEGIGAGVLIDADRVLTAAHVVHGADEVLVALSDGSRIPGRVISSEQSADLALVQLAHAPKGPVPARLADSDRTEIGDEVVTVGAPLGLSYTLTTGHISARHAPNTPSMEFKRAEFFQTDAAVNQGNSGGPLFNMDGEVVGIISYIKTTSGGSMGLGFAVTSNTARELMLEQPPFYSGLEALVLSGDMARALNVPQPVGLLVQRVARGSFAERLGLRGGHIPVRIGDQLVLLGGDIVLEVEGVTMGDPDTRERIRQAVHAKGPGEEIRVRVLREGRVGVLAAYVL